MRLDEFRTATKELKKGDRLFVKLARGGYVGKVREVLPSAICMAVKGRGGGLKWILFVWIESIERLPAKENEKQ